jgi:hypothetical protein
MRNIITVVDGIKFRSRKEAKRYRELRLMEHVEDIRELRVHPRWQLFGKTEQFPALSYEADFCYRDKAGVLIVEDVKGRRAGVQYDLFKAKKRLMWEIHRIYVEEV